MGSGEPSSGAVTREGRPSICRELLLEKATLLEKQKLCSVSSMCKVAATMGHFGWEPGTPGRRAARNLRHHVPKNLKGLEPRPTEKPLACVVGIQAVE